MPATLATPNPLEAVCLVVGIVKSAASLQRCLIGQIKLTRIHVLPVFLPGVRVKRDSGASLYNVERSANQAFAGFRSANFVSLLSHTCVPEVRDVPVARSLPRAASQRQQANPDGDSIFFLRKKMVEPDGIEPTTSCLQSRRSPS